MRPRLPVLLAGFVPLLLSGCAAGAAGLALTGASLLSSLMTDGPAGEPPIDFNPNRALSETLAGAGHDVDPLCRARLDSLERQHGPIEPPPSGGCALQPVCLGGMQSPMQVTVCADGARAHSPAASAQADTPASAAWIWANGGDTEETVGTPPLAPDTSE